MRGEPQGRKWSGRAVVLLPCVWLVVFFLTPFVIVLKISLSQTALAQPPYSPVFDLSAGWAGFLDFARQLSLESFRLLFTDLIYLLSYLKSLQVAAISTLILVLVGYPFAYGIARAPRGWQPLLVMAVVLPFWTSFLIRVYAWINILQRDGLLNDVLMRLHIVDVPLIWLSSDTAIYIGIVYSYLPFMVLPLYAALEKKWTRACWRRPPILAARGGRRFGLWSCRCRCQVRQRARCSASFRLSVNSSFPTCSAARKR